MGLIEGLSAVKTGFDLAKNIGDLAKKGEIDGNEVAARLIALQSYLLDSQRTLNEAREEQIAMAEKIKSLEAELSKKPSLAFDPPFWWKEGDKTPYCPNCWESKVRPIHVILAFSNAVTTRWDCPQCKSSYPVKSGAGRLPPDERVSQAPPRIRTDFP